MTIAALDTGMRRGEMLAIRFGDVDWKRRLIVLRGATTKSRRTRVVPIGTSRLLAVLEWLQLDSTGGRKSDDIRVFSDEAGEPLKTFKKAWQVAVLKAHGVDPQWRRKGSYKDLTPECQQRFRAINLHWHDPRHEYASRLVERGVPLAQVRDLLGHASILTTERYDNQTLEALQAAVQRLESGKEFDASQPRPQDEVSRFFQDRTQVQPTSAADTTTETNATALRKKELQDWYRYGESNPGPVAENHVS